MHHLHGSHAAVAHRSLCLSDDSLVILIHLLRATIYCFTTPGSLTRQTFEWAYPCGFRPGGGLGGSGMGLTPETLAAMRLKASEAPFYAPTHNLTPLGANKGMACAPSASYASHAGWGLLLIPVGLTTQMAAETTYQGMTLQGQSQHPNTGIYDPTESALLPRLVPCQV